MYLNAQNDEGWLEVNKLYIPTIGDLLKYKYSKNFCLVISEYSIHFGKVSTEYYFDVCSFVEQSPSAIKKFRIVLDDYEYGLLLFLRET